VSESLIRWHVYANSDQLIKAVVNAIAAEAVRAISAAGSFLIVVGRKNSIGIVKLPIDFMARPTGFEPVTPAFGDRKVNCK